MRAVYYEEFGPAEVLKLGDLPVPEPGPGQVLVQVAATSVNPIERRLRAGELQAFFTRRFPIVPGWDVAGRIAKLGPEVTGWQVGERVAGLAFTYALQHGTYAEYVPVSVTSIARIPEPLSFIEAAGLPLVGLTAWQSIVEEAEIRRGQRVLIQAGAGGIGSVATAIAKHCGAFVYTTTRAANFDYVRARGVDRPIDYTVEDYRQVLRAAEPEGVDLILETLEDESMIRDDIGLVRTGGSVIYLNNPPPETDEIVRRRIHTLFLHHRADGAMLAGLLERFAHGALPLPEITVRPLADAIEAHRQSESWRTRGKLVLQVAEI